MERKHKPWSPLACCAVPATAVLQRGVGEVVATIAEEDERALTAKGDTGRQASSWRGQQHLTLGGSVCLTAPAKVTC